MRLTKHWGAPTRLDMGKSGPDEKDEGEDYGTLGDFVIGGALSGVILGAIMVARHNDEVRR